MSQQQRVGGGFGGGGGGSGGSGVGKGPILSSLHTLQLLRKVLIASLVLVSLFSFLIMYKFSSATAPPSVVILDVSGQARALEIYKAGGGGGGEGSLSGLLPKKDPCTVEYERMTSQQTAGLTEEDLLRSRAWVGNEERLAKFVTKLEKSKTASAEAPVGSKNAPDPVSVVVCGGSITLGHGVVPLESRYSDRLQNWLNQLFPLPKVFEIGPDGKKKKKKSPKHRVYNRGAHGADMCAMAKRMDLIFGKLGADPDLVILEFAVNDYQGQDHKIHLDHKTDVFFEGFQEKATCAEAVIHNLIYKYPNTAIMFLEFQTAILNRKTAQVLHIGVAQHYQIPVISYAETVMPGYYTLLEKLKAYDYSAPIGDPVAPFPHGCAPCLAEHIVEDFRAHGCKSVCIFASRSGFPTKDCNNPPPGREQCMLPFFAHDAVHPSYVGHGIATDLIVNAFARTKQKVCQGQNPPPHILPPPSINFLESDQQLKLLTDWVMVKDTMDVFSEKDPLLSHNHSKGFKLYGDGMAERTGWIATDEAGWNYVEFNVNLPQGCYVLYISSLKSYEGMGSYTAIVTDEQRKSQFRVYVDGYWEPHISVPADIALKPPDIDARCTGNCTVTVQTHPIKPERNGNKVKIMTLSARKCRIGEFDRFQQQQKQQQ